MEERTRINIQYLIFGAKLQKQVEILYHYKSERSLLNKRYGSIQPIKWVYGKDNDLQILAWDTEKENWRRFNVQNIERVAVTDTDWTNVEIEETVSCIAP